MKIVAINSARSFNSKSTNGQKNSAQLLSEAFKILGNLKK